MVVLLQFLDVFVLEAAPALDGAEHVVEDGLDAAVAVVLAGLRVGEGDVGDREDVALDFERLALLLLQVVEDVLLEGGRDLHVGRHFR